MIRHRVSEFCCDLLGGGGLGLPATIAAALMRDLPALELGSLQVTGGGTMYPDFAGGDASLGSFFRRWRGACR